MDERARQPELVSGSHQNGAASAMLKQVQHDVDKSMIIFSKNNFDQKNHK
jgi:hypothetical protein